MLKAALFTNCNLTESDVEKILRRAVISKSLDFSGATLTSDMANLIVDSIASNRLYSYTLVDISHCNLSLSSFESIVDLATNFRNLETFLAANNNLPKEAGVLISRLLGAHSRLQVLNVSDNNLGDSGVAPIAGVFTSDLSPSQLSAPLSTPSPMGSLRSLMTLTSLDLSGNGFGDMGVLALCRGLGTFSSSTANINATPSLRVLLLNRNYIGEKGAQCLGRLLATASPRFSNAARFATRKSGNLHVEEIGLSDNPIGATGLCSFLQSISSPTGTTLKKLSLARCEPTIDVLRTFADSLMSQNTIWEAVDLSFTETDSKLLLNKEYERHQHISGVMQLAVSYESMDAIFRKLSNAVINGASQLQILSLGSLPEAIRIAVEDSSAPGFVSSDSRFGIDPARTPGPLPPYSSRKPPLPTDRISTSLPTSEMLGTMKQSMMYMKDIRSVLLLPEEFFQSVSLSLSSTVSSTTKLDSMSTPPADRATLQPTLVELARSPHAMLSVASPSVVPLELSTCHNEDSEGQSAGNRANDPVTEQPTSSKHDLTTKNSVFSQAVEKQQREFSRLREEHAKAMQALASNIASICDQTTRSSGGSNNNEESKSKSRELSPARQPTTSRESNIVPHGTTFSSQSPTKLHRDASSAGLTRHGDRSSDVVNESSQVGTAKTSTEREFASMNRHELAAFVQTAVSTAVNEARNEWLDNRPSFVVDGRTVELQTPTRPRSISSAAEKQLTQQSPTQVLQGDISASYPSSPVTRSSRNSSGPTSPRISPNKTISSRNARTNQRQSSRTPVSSSLPVGHSVSEMVTPDLAALMAKMDVLQDRLQLMEAQNLVKVMQSKTASPIDPGTKLAASPPTKSDHVDDANMALQLNDLERRVARLEQDMEIRHQNTVQQLQLIANGHNFGRNRWDILETEFSQRMDKLEKAMEQEHESSMQVLDALMIQQRQFKQMQLLAVGSSGGLTSTPSSNASQQERSSSAGGERTETEPWDGLRRSRQWQPPQLQQFNKPLRNSSGGLTGFSRLRSSDPSPMTLGTASSHEYSSGVTADGTDRLEANRRQYVELQQKRRHQQDLIEQQQLILEQRMQQHQQQQEFRAQSWQPTIATRSDPNSARRSIKFA